MHEYALTLLRIRGKAPLPVSPVTSTIIGISTQHFLTFSFNPGNILVPNFEVIPSDSLTSLSLNQEHPSKNMFFWSNPYKIEVMKTYRNARVTKFWSNVHIYNTI